jgi:hypothetical protein
MRGRNPSADSGAGPAEGGIDLALSSEKYSTAWDGSKALNPSPGYDRSSSFFEISSSLIRSAHSSEPYNTPSTSA